MKLSEMNTDQAFTVMEKLLPVVSNIMSDEEVQLVRGNIQRDEHDKILIKDTFQPVTALFLGKHRESMFELAAAVSGKTAKQVKEQPLSVTIEALKDALDGEMMGFFGVCLRMVMTV